MGSRVETRRFQALWVTAGFDFVQLSPTMLITLTRSDFSRRFPLGTFGARFVFV
jgi:hypothetical protein